MNTEIMLEEGFGTKETLPFVLNANDDKRGIIPSDMRFIAIPTRNGFDFVFNVNTEIKNMNSMHVFMLRKQPACMFPVRFEKRTHRKAPRLVVPSMNTARIPASSLTKAATVNITIGSI